MSSKSKKIKISIEKKSLSKEQYNNLSLNKKIDYQTQELAKNIKKKIKSEGLANINEDYFFSESCKSFSGIIKRDLNKEREKKKIKKKVIPKKQLTEYEEWFKTKE